MLFHEAEIHENFIQRSLRLEHQQVVRNMNVEIIQDAKRIQNLCHRWFAVEVAQPVFRRVLESQENPE